MRRDEQKLRRWELALALSLCLTLFHGVSLGALSGANWWGVIFPGLTAEAVQAEAGAFPGGGVEIRFRVLEWLGAVLG